MRVICFLLFSIPLIASQLSTCLLKCPSAVTQTKPVCAAASAVLSCAQDNNCYTSEVANVCTEISTLGLCPYENLNCPAASDARTCQTAAQACAATRARTQSVKIDTCAIVQIQLDCAKASNCYTQQLQYVCETFADFGCSLDCQKSCPDINWPANGRRLGENYLVGSTIKFYCNDDLVVSGANSTECLADATWSNPVPACVSPKACTLPTLANIGPTVKIDKDSVKDNYLAGQTITFRCAKHPNWELQGSATATCATDGSWSEFPTCTEKEGPGGNWWIILIVLGILCLIVFPLVLCVYKQILNDPNTSGKGGIYASVASPQGSPVPREMSPVPSQGSPTLQQGGPDPLHQTTFMGLQPSMDMSGIQPMDVTGKFAPAVGVSPVLTPPAFYP